MGSSEVDKSGEENEPKTPSSSSAPVTSQEPSSAVATPDWSGFQAYSPMPPHGYVASSPQPHPYMWGVQHMIPPYGTPPHPYVAMYPPGGMYAHPSIPPGSYPYSPYAMPSPNGMAEASGNTGSGVEGDGKQAEERRTRLEKTQEHQLMELVLKGIAESGSDGSSEGSDANSQNDSGSRHNGKDGETASDSAQGPPRNGSNQPVNQIVPVTPVSATGVPAPPTNLNMGMDYWSGHGTTVPGVVVDGSQSQTWVQDERELKRQRRKESNRESARRSRLRKQAECDELAQRADVLNGENASLRAEINKLRSQYEELVAENNALKNRFSTVRSLGVNLDGKEQEPETNTSQDVAETTRGSYNNSA
ncbi:hypothetical protein IGI04_036324 [Brassica rapa subsp. trilocularis]|uniref:BZIP domain-containing protein n=1 Tax=Brassica rapa subsp. trilocularis TaxID=1813537 RepID=A0ABQ7LH63_BRACM|nr:hypothetical protein IGI04_036324 [Brassica rapa subsp. trilocularis]